MSGQICKKAFLKQLRKKGFLNLQQISELLERLRSITRRDIVHFLKILKLHRYLKRARLRYGNAVTVDILW